MTQGAVVPMSRAPSQRRRANGIGAITASQEHTRHSNPAMQAVQRDLTLLLASREQS